jgi:hypothetical protein
MRTAVRESLAVVGAAFAVVIGIVVVLCLLASIWVGFERASENDFVSQIQSINQFHGNRAPTADEIWEEVAALRHSYGVSYSDTTEVMRAMARTGVNWEQQKKLAATTIIMAQASRSCGGEC